MSEQQCEYVYAAVLQGKHWTRCIACSCGWTLWGSAETLRAPFREHLAQNPLGGRWISNKDSEQGRALHLRIYGSLPDEMPHAN